MSLLKKHKIKLLVLFGLLGAIFLFQNCSKQFASQCNDDKCSEWKSTVAENQLTAEMQKIAFYDEKQYEILATSSELIKHQIFPAESSTVPPFFGDEFAAVVHLPANYQGSVFNIHSENINVESAWLTLQDGKVFVGHSTATNSFYSMSFPLLPTDKDIVIGVYFGVKVIDIRVVLNGRLITADNTTITTETIGAPSNFSYIEKNLALNSAIREAFIFNRKLSTYELASMSRHINFLKKLNVTVYDENIKLDSDVDFVQERPEFIAARNVLKANHCFNCHGSWISYGEYNFIATELVKPNNVGQSSLWTRLAGTLEPDRHNKRKDMPLKEQPLKDEELDTIKTWIRSIDPGVSMVIGAPNNE